MTDEEKQAIDELKAMTPEELANVPADLYRWHCCVKDCDRFTKVKSFATFPLVLYSDRWEDLTTRVYFCARHWKNRLAFMSVRKTALKPGAGVEHCTPIKPKE